MESIWALANVAELEFFATSKLLAMKTKKQSIAPTEQLHDEPSDEDEREEDEEDCATARPSSRLAKSQHHALVNKFLDRLAELFSREKSSSGCRSRQDSKHVAATAWINADGGTKEALTVTVAKNEGLDDRDVKMLDRLQRWLRGMAVTGKVQSAQTDVLWVANEGLVGFSRHRLWYYISWLKKNDGRVASLAALSTDATVQFARFQCLCRDINRNSASQQFSKIVDAAYALRSAWKVRSVPREHTKAIRAINMLGRLRAAYECFKSVALTFDAIADLEMKPIPHQQDTRKRAILPHTLLQRILAECNLPMDSLKDESEHGAASRLHVHAEMQVLVSLTRDSNWHARAHPYMYRCEQETLLPL